MSEPPGLCQDISNLKFLLGGKAQKPCKQHLGKKIIQQFFEIWNFSEWVLAVNLIGFVKAGTHICLRRKFAQGNTLGVKLSTLEDVWCEKHNIGGSQGCLDNQGNYF